MKRALQSRGAITSVNLRKLFGRRTLREQRPLKENTQWKLSFPLCFSMVEQGETKGRRRSQRGSMGKKITRSTKHLRDARPLVCFCKTANNTRARRHTRCNTHRLRNVFSTQWDVTVAKGRSFKAIIMTASSLCTDTRQCEYITKSLNILLGIWPAFLAADTALL